RRLSRLLVLLLLRLAPALALLLGLAAGAVAALGELDQREGSGVAAARTELGDARIAAGPAAEARADVVEQLADDGAAADEGQRLAGGVQGVALAERDHALGPAAQLLGLGVGGLQVLVLQQRRDQIAEERAPVRAGSIELTAAFEVSHADS